MNREKVGVLKTALVWEGEDKQFVLVWLSQEWVLANPGFENQ